MPTITIDVPKQFSRYPAGRFRSDGKYSGEAFRDDYLVPALDTGGKVVVQLDGAAGYGSSFLEEAFGGLVREHGFDSAALHRRLAISTGDPNLNKEIWFYIDEASNREPQRKRA